MTSGTTSVGQARQKWRCLSIIHSSTFGQTLKRTEIKLLLVFVTNVTLSQKKKPVCESLEMEPLNCTVWFPEVNEGILKIYLSFESTTFSQCVFLNVANSTDEFAYIKWSYQKKTKWKFLSATTKKSGKTNTVCNLQLFMFLDTFKGSHKLWLPLHSTSVMQTWNPRQWIKQCVSGLHHNN